MSSVQLVDTKKQKKKQSKKRIAKLRKKVMDKMRGEKTFLEELKKTRTYRFPEILHARPLTT